MVYIVKTELARVWENTPKEEKVMSAVGLSTVLPDRGQHQHFVIPRAPRKESPPEIINHEFDHTRASLAATGNRAFIMRDTRRGLRMLSSPADPESAAVADQHQTRLSLSKLSGSHSNASEGNLWIIPPNDKGKRRRPERTTAVVEIKLPLQSPIRQVQWWRRPPSPLVSHMRPLWESNAGGDHIMVDLAPPDMKKIPRRAPEEGEEIAEESRHLRRTRGSQVRYAFSRHDRSPVSPPKFDFSSSNSRVQDFVRSLKNRNECSLKNCELWLSFGKFFPFCFDV